MDRRRLILSNQYEAETHRVLEETAAKLGARVFPKVRIADAIDVSRSGLSGGEFQYALKAHFDIVVTDESSQTQFAVEYDGRGHETDPDTIRRDALKNSICDKLGFPLLRIGDEFFRKIGRFTLLGWLAEVWFLDQAFTQAQERGEVPYDEVFDYSMILGFAFRDQGRLVHIDDLESEEQVRLLQKHMERMVITRPYDPFIPSRAYIQRAYDTGACRRLSPEELHGTDPSGYSIAVAILPVSDDRYIIGHARVRSFRFPPVGPFELAGELAVVDAATRLMRYREGVEEADSEADVGAWRKRLEAWREYR
jgi:hypothetical protein